MFFAKPFLTFKVLYVFVFSIVGVVYYVYFRESGTWLRDYIFTFHDFGDEYVGYFKNEYVNALPDFMSLLMISGFSVVLYEFVLYCFVGYKFYNKVLSIILCVISFGILTSLEFCQKYEVIGGTFDLIDVYSYIIGFIVSLFLFVFPSKSLVSLIDESVAC